MLTTISLGTCISMQGELVARLPNGNVVVRDGDKHYSGRPIRPQLAQQRPEAGAAA